MLPMAVRGIIEYQLSLVLNACYPNGTAKGLVKQREKDFEMGKSMTGDGKASDETCRGAHVTAEDNRNDCDWPHPLRWSHASLCSAITQTRNWYPKPTDVQVITRTPQEMKAIENIVQSWRRVHLISVIIPIALALTVAFAHA